MFLTMAHEILRVDDLDFAGYLDEIRVLLVDDSRTARRFIRRILESLGLERFEEVDDGAKALSLLEEESFDLVVTDLNMPHMDGMELTRRARVQGLRPEVPIIMVTSEQNQKRRAQAMEAGLSALIDKPFEPGLVRNLLEELLDVA